MLCITIEVSQAPQVWNLMLNMKVDMSSSLCLVLSCPSECCCQVLTVTVTAPGSKIYTEFGRAGFSNDSCGCVSGQFKREFGLGKWRLRACSVQPEFWSLLGISFRLYFSLIVALKFAGELGTLHPLPGDLLGWSSRASSAVQIHCFMLIQVE